MSKEQAAPFPLADEAHETHGRQAAVAQYMQPPSITRQFQAKSRSHGPQRSQCEETDVLSRFGHVVVPLPGQIIAWRHEFGTDDDEPRLLGPKSHAG